MRKKKKKVLKFIKENIGKISYGKMSEKLDIPKSTIGWLVYRHKIKNDKSLIKECKKFTKTEKEYSDYVKKERHKLENKFKEFLEKIGENRLLKLKNGCDMKYIEQFETAQFINIIPTEFDAIIKVEILEAK